MAVTCRETRTNDAGRRTVRRSTAVFRREADGLIVWRHLHETPVGARADTTCPAPDSAGRCPCR
ncbi:hypothetical protein DIE21_01785 [Burkholderia sp. Bp9140]|nr:hypothetical protein DIE21_01785 [Burkholderia sp. Bp9140]